MTVTVASAVLLVSPVAAHAATAGPAASTVTISADAKRIVFGDPDPAFTYTVSGLASGDRLTRNPTCSVAAAHAAAGNYSITCAGAAANAARYKLVYSPGTLTVAKATVTVVPDAASRAVGQPDPTFTYKVTGLKGADRLTKNPVCAVTGPHSAAGSYPITCSGADAGANYSVVYAQNSLTVTSRGTVYVYGNYAQKFYGAADPAFGYTVSGLPTGTKLSSEPTCTVTVRHVNVGDYPITCSGAVAPAGYDITYLSSGSTVLRVLQAPLVIYADGVGKLYGAADPAFTYEVLGLQSGDSLLTKPTCSVAAKHVDVGDYRIVCGGGDAGPNYAITYADNADTVLRILPAPVYVGAYDQTGFYGANDPTFTYLAIGLQGNDSFVTAPTCSVAAAHSEPGTYSIVCSGGDAGRNYTISYLPGTFTVKKAPTALKAQANAYGDGRVGTMSATIYTQIPWPASKPLSGVTVTFSTGGSTLCSAVTDDYGTASCSVGLDLRLLNSDTYTATYAGTTEIDAASDTVSSHG